MNQLKKQMFCVFMFVWLSFNTSGNQTGYCQQRRKDWNNGVLDDEACGAYETEELLPLGTW